MQIRELFYCLDADFRQPKFGRDAPGFTRLQGRTLGGLEKFCALPVDAVSFGQGKEGGEISEPAREAAADAVVPVLHRECNPGGPKVRDAPEILPRSALDMLFRHPEPVGNLPLYEIDRRRVPERPPAEKVV